MYDNDRAEGSKSVPPALVLYITKTGENVMYQQCYLTTQVKGSTTE